MQSSKISSSLVSEESVPSVVFTVTFSQVIRIVRVFAGDNAVQDVPNFRTPRKEGKRNQLKCLCSNVLLRIQQQRGYFSHIIFPEE